MCGCWRCAVQGYDSGMNESELFGVALGLSAPWLVKDCSFDVVAGRLDIHLDFQRGSVFDCPDTKVAIKARSSARPHDQEMNQKPAGYDLSLIHFVIRSQNPFNTRKAGAYEDET